MKKWEMPKVEELKIAATACPEKVDGYCPEAGTYDKCKDCRFYSGCSEKEEAFS